MYTYLILSVVDLFSWIATNPMTMFLGCVLALVLLALWVSLLSLSHLTLISFLFFSLSFSFSSLPPFLTYFLLLRAVVIIAIATLRFVFLSVSGYVSRLYSPLDEMSCPNSTVVR